MMIWLKMGIQSHENKRILKNRGGVFKNQGDILTFKKTTCSYMFGQFFDPFRPYVHDLGIMDFETNIDMVRGQLLFHGESLTFLAGPGRIA
jgi:hypothetical protein